MIFGFSIGDVIAFGTGEKMVDAVLVVIVEALVRVWTGRSLV